MWIAPADRVSRPELLLIASALETALAGSVPRPHRQLLGVAVEVGHDSLTLGVEAEAGLALLVCRYPVIATNLPKCALK
jgi:hypothetical protein